MDDGEEGRAGEGKVGRRGGQEGKEEGKEEEGAMHMCM